MTDHTDEPREQREPTHEPVKNERVIYSECDDPEETVTVEITIDEEW